MTAAVHAGPSPGRLVLMCVPGITLGDLDPRLMPSVARLLPRSAFGLMNARIAYLRMPDPQNGTADPSRAGAYATLGAGTRCAGGALDGEALGARETTAEGAATAVYERRNGVTPDAKAFVMNPLRLRDENTGMGYAVEPGSLGDLLRAAGIRAAVVGEADRPDEPHREAALAAMDSRGRLHSAWFDLSRPDPDGPLGLSMPAGDVASAVSTALQSSRLVVVEAGDAARLDDERPSQLPARRSEATSALMRRIDVVIGSVAARLNLSRDRLLLVVPYPSRSSRTASDLLTPVLLIGPDGAGLLTSATTRRTGIVANTDIAPTVASLLGAGPAPRSWVGRPIRVVPAAGSFARLSAERDRLMRVEAVRRALLSGLITLLLWAMLGFAGLTIAWKGTIVRWVPLGILVAPAALPFALLILSASPGLSPSEFAVGLIGLVGLICVLSTAAARIRGRACDAIVVLAGLTAGTAILDGLAGFPHMAYCILSYSLMEGARYYGIGNEFMGAFLAATVLVVAVAVPNRPSRRALGAVVLLFSIAMLVLAGPRFGAKFGGAISGAAAFGLCGLLLAHRPIHLRSVAGLLIFCAAAVGLSVVVDRLLGSGSSHIGRAFDAVRVGGASELWSLIERKASMEIHLLLFSPWSRLAGAELLAAAAWLQSRRARGLTTVPEGPPGAGVLGILAAAAVAVAVDDAGVLAAATALLFLPPLLAAADRDAVASPPDAGHNVYWEGSV